MVLPDVKSLNEDLREYTDASVSWTITKAALYSMARDDDSQTWCEYNVNFLDQNSKARPSCLSRNYKVQYVLRIKTSKRLRQYSARNSG